jgi:signal transduction histidine kinase
MKQVLLNLIINAVQATVAHGTVSVRSYQSQGKLRIEVQDQGEGLTLMQQENIFHPFFTTKENGTGLGLAIASNIVAQHGGHLTGNNNRGRGATFRIELPFERPPAPGNASSRR